MPASTAAASATHSPPSAGTLGAATSSPPKPQATTTTAPSKTSSPSTGTSSSPTHPPCTHLAVSGARWFKDKQAEQAEALAFVQLLLDAPITHIALENPVSIISTRIRRPTQVIQPWQFGHGETKATCLWLKNLPPLIPTNIVEGRENRIHRLPPSPDRWKERSRTYPGIATAMATQWTSHWNAHYPDRQVSPPSA